MGVSCKYLLRYEVKTECGVFTRLWADSNEFCIVTKVGASHIRCTMSQIIKATALQMMIITTRQRTE